MDPIKIALVMTGAVSLGSFEAGVLTELLWALEQHSKDGKKYELDVITGASAGAMTAGLVANLVMNDYSRRANLYKAWVEMVTIENLLKNPPDNAFLSSVPVQQIGNACLSPYASGGRAPFAPDVLRMTLTISNLNGVDRALMMAGGQPFVSTFFDDRKLFRLVDDPKLPPPDNPNARINVRDRATWDQVRDFAIASGSFPLAFPPLPLARVLAEYDLPGTIGRNFTTDPMFVDGGTFNNQPIGEAVKLAREADDGHFGQPRKYFFVNATVNNSIFKSADAMKAIVAAPQTLAPRLAEIIYNESRTSDYIRALLINDQIFWRDEWFLDTLIDLVKSTNVSDPEGFIAHLRSVAQSIVEGRRKVSARVGSTPFETLLERSRARYKSQLDAGGVTDPNRRAVLELIVFSLDHISDLDERKQIEIYSLSSQARLAGEKLGAFAGFFKQEYRQYNYRQGRKLAHEQLVHPDILGPYDREDGPAEFQKYEIEPGWEGFPDEELDRTPVEPRKILRDQTVARAEKLVDDCFKNGWWITDWLKRQVISRAVGYLVASRLNALLKL